MQKLMGDEGWGGGALFFSTDPKCLWLHLLKTRSGPVDCRRSIFANGADPDQTPQNAASDQGLRYLLTESYIEN